MWLKWSNTEKCREILRGRQIPVDIKDPVGIGGVRVGGAWGQKGVIKILF